MFSAFYWCFLVNYLYPSFVSMQLKISAVLIFFKNVEWWGFKCMQKCQPGEFVSPPQKMYISWSPDNIEVTSVKLKDSSLGLNYNHQIHLWPSQLY